MRIVSAVLLLALTSVWATDGLAQSAATLWDHNGSQVSLSANGASRQFHYQVPTTDLQQVGIRPGTLLFDGRRDGNRYLGSAYVYTKFCGALQYWVAGPVSADQRTVTMSGRAPLVNTSCRVTGYRDDILIFNLSIPTGTIANPRTAEQKTLPLTSASPGQTVDREYGEFRRQWELCFDLPPANQSIDVHARTCDAALSYPRILAQDRALLIERRRTVIAQKLLFDERSLVSPTRGPERLRERADNKSETSEKNAEKKSSIPSSVSGPTALEGSSVRTRSDPWIMNPVVIVGGIVGSVAAMIILAGVAGRRWPDPVSSTATMPNTAHNSDALMEQTLPVSFTRPPTEAMSLKLKRSQRLSLMGKVIFALDARMALNAEEHFLVKKYRLGDVVIYDSKAREKYTEFNEGAPRDDERACCFLFGCKVAVHRCWENFVSPWACIGQCHDCCALTSHYGRRVSCEVCTSNARVWTSYLQQRLRSWKRVAT